VIHELEDGSTEVLEAQQVLHPRPPPLPPPPPPPPPPPRAPSIFLPRRGEPATPPSRANNPTPARPLVRFRDGPKKMARPRAESQTVPHQRPTPPTLPPALLHRKPRAGDTRRRRQPRPFPRAHCGGQLTQREPPSRAHRRRRGQKHRTSEI